LGRASLAVSGALAALVALMLALGLLIPVAHAAPTNPRAVRLAKKGIKLYRAHKYAEALKVLGEGYQVEPDPQFRWAMGRCAEKLGDLPAALQHYEAFLAGYPDAPNKGEVQGLIQYVRQRLKLTMADLRVTSTPPGASVVLLGHPEAKGLTPFQRWLPPGDVTVRVSMAGYLSAERKLTLVLGDGPKNTVNVALISPDAPGQVVLAVGEAAHEAAIEVDGAAAGTLPRAAPLELTPGQHTVRATKPGFKPFEATVDVKPGSRQTVEVFLAPEAMLDLPGGTPAGGDAPGAGVAARGSVGGGGLPATTWVLGGVGGASLVAGGVLLGLGFSDAADARDYATAAGPSPSEAQVQEHRSMADSAKSEAIAGYALLGVGGAALVAAVIVAATDDGGAPPSPSDPGPTHAASSTDPRWGVAPIPHGLTFGLSGSF